MISYANPTAVRHQGRGVLIAERTTTDEASQVTRRDFVYNILAQNNDVVDDGLGWQGFFPLSTEPSQQTSLAGFSVLRLSGHDVTQGAAQVVSDETHIYVFRADGQTLLVDRFVLVETADASARDGRGYALEPDWEVRFRSSASADLPASETDVSAYRDPEGTPFISPRRYLSFAPGAEAIDLQDGFGVLLMPASEPGVTQWRVFARRRDGTRLFVYVIPRLDDGWFDLGATSLDDAGRIQPVASFALSLEAAAAALSLTGFPAAALYQQLEPMVSSEGEAVQMRTVNRLLLACPAMETARAKAGGHDDAHLLTLDFEVGADGGVAFDGAMDQALAVGPTRPEALSVDFPLPSEARIATPVQVPGGFTLQAWLSPQRGPVGSATANQARQVIGDTRPPEQRGPTLEIVNQFRVKVSFGTGEKAVAATTVDSVLTYGSWSNITATCDGDVFRIFVNGTEVEVDADAPGGAGPAGAIDRLGLGPGGYVGQLTEVRVWTRALSQAEIRSHVFAPLRAPDEEADLAAYWPMDGGVGSTIVDASGRGHDATMFGSVWLDWAAPLARPDRPINQLDPQNRAVAAGLLTPLEDYPSFGPVASAARPAVLPAADGPLHVYYPGPGRTLTVARCSGIATRAFFIGDWAARDGAGATKETGNVVYITRQTGPYNSFATIKIDGNPDGLTSDATFKGPSDNFGLGQDVLRAFARTPSVAAETWKGVPRRLELFERIINGQAVTDPNEPRISEGRAVFYDYSGARTQALLRLGDQALLSALRFVSTQASGITLASIAATRAGSELTVSVTLNEPKGAVIRARFGPVPATAGALANLFRGVAADAAYAMNRSSTPVWGLPGSSTHLFILAPRLDADGNPAVTAARFSLTAGPTYETASFKAELTVGGRVIAAEWTEVPRAGAGFIAALEAGAAPEQRQVAGELVFLDRLEGQLLDANALTITEMSDLRYVTALIAVIREGADGDVEGAFAMDADRLQGVTGRTAEPNETIASRLVSVQTQARPNSGYAAAVSPGETGGRIILASPGRNGGWLRDPPRYAQAFDGTGALAVDLAALVPAPDVYETPGPVSIEAWLKPAPSYWIPNSTNPTVQSVVHFSAGAAGTGYGLAYRPSETPRFFQGVAFEIGDAKVPGDQLDDKLVRDGAYTMQIYIRPVLLAAGADWFFRRRDGETVLEQLSIDVQPSDAGRPTRWRPVYECGGERMTTREGVLFPGEEWTMLTLVRRGSVVTLYINGEEANRRDDIDMPSAAVETFNVANPSEVFEFEPNEFAVWNIARSAQEVRENYLLPLAGAEAGLVVLFPMARGEANYTLTNRSRWTTTLYDTVLARNPFYTKTGLFFDVIAQFGDRSSVTSNAVLSPHRWRHVAALLARRGALLLGDGSAKASGRHEIGLGEGFAVDARVRLTAARSSRQVIIGRFGAERETQIYELGVQADGRAYVTVRLRPTSGDATTANPDLFTAFGDPARRIRPGVAHHVAASLELVSLGDKTTGRQVTALDAVVYVDGPGAQQINPPPRGAVNDFRFVKVIGGSGSGYYKADALVRIEAHDKTRFERWYGTVAFDDQQLSRPETEFRMPGGADFADVVITANAFVEAMMFAEAATPTRVGVSGDGGAWSGQLSDVRLWARALRSDEVAVIAGQPGATPYDDQLTSWWPFAEHNGRLAKDAVGDNDLTLSSSTLWDWFDGASTSILIDGVPTVSTGMRDPLENDTPRQFRIGGYVTAANALRATMRGELDELRLWRGMRSREEIANNMARYLTGAEPGLMGYWRFDTGSGDIVIDRTIHLGNARYFDAAGGPAPIGWIASDAPIGFDAPIVDDALDARRSSAAVQLADRPIAVTAFEYPDTLRTGEGAARSVLKRSYVYDGIGGLTDDTGYKVGDLERVYVGQVQTDPTVVGYIEGAPPLPSENLTRPLTGPSDVDAYVGIASVTLADEQSQSTNLVFANTDDTQVDLKTEGGGGLDFTSETVLGLPPAMTTIETVDLALGVSAHLNALLETHEEATSTLSSSSSRGMTHSLGNDGRWEARGAEGRFFLDSGERRYIPSNIGSALVKSRVADLFALKIKSTGALISLSAEPNPDIPVDINIIRFPIDPLYQLAGSLDGRVGLQKAPLTETSYYKPREAYTLKREVERQREALKAYFERTDLYEVFDREVGIEAARSGNPAFSRELANPVRDMVNTYVWAAGAGTYAESEGFSTELTETYSVGHSDTTGVGLAQTMDYALPGGSVKASFEVVETYARRFNATKTFSRNRAMSLQVEAAPDSFMYKFDQNREFIDEPVPGKVDGYRFMTFFLANRNENASDLFTKVIDQQWLNQSQSPNAAALREAQAVSDAIAPWRILHRVTFVSRVPPAFQAVPALTDQAAPPEAPNQDHNAVFLRLVRAKLPTGSIPASAISTAVRAVLEEDLPVLLPWWSAFLAAARVDNSQEQTEYRETISDAVDYAVSVIGTTA